ncbi:MAG: glycosyltransferase family 2 protein [Chloroflexota bacterium]
MNGPRSEDYRALVCITTCERPGYLRRYLPHFARFCAGDPRFPLLVALDGDDEETRRFCAEWRVPLIHSREREGVGLSKNRVLERFPDFDYYFFVEDDVELIDGVVFPAHVELAQASEIHHFSLFSERRIGEPAGESRIAGRRVAHSFVGSARFNFFTAEGLRQVGGWHPRFAEYRRWGHTEHSYRFYNAGLAPAPFNVATELSYACIWHLHPSVTPLSLPGDEEEIVAPERELIDEKLRHVPLQTLSPYELNDVPFGELDRLAATLDAGERYPLVEAAERRHCRSDYQLWRCRWAKGRGRRAAALLAAAWQWPSNPMLKRTVRMALRRE